MIRYCCDRCKRTLEADELRYVIRLEVQAAMEPAEMDDVDDDRDHLLEIQEILERLEDGEGDAVGEDIYQRRRYNLCADCHRRFIENPLGAAASVHLPFSSN